MYTIKPGILAYYILLAIILAIIFFWTKTVNPITLGRDGIFYGKRHFRWEDYCGAYLAVPDKGRGHSYILVLLAHNNNVKIGSIAFYYELNNVATTIRDFQPFAWKEIILAG